MTAALGSERPRQLRMLVPDSGRTWAVMYHEINLIPPNELEIGDVLIVSHRTEPGVMAMQATERVGDSWTFDPLDWDDTKAADRRAHSDELEVDGAADELEERD